MQLIKFACTARQLIVSWELCGDVGIVFLERKEEFNNQLKYLIIQYYCHVFPKHYYAYYERKIAARKSFVTIWPIDKRYRN